MTPLRTGTGQRENRHAGSAPVSGQRVRAGRGARTLVGAAAALLVGLGVPHAARALVGGTLTADGQWPSAVFLEAAGCSGAVIAPRVVLTAAHCLAGQPGRRERILIGDDLRSPRRIVSVDRCYVHPGFRFSSSDDDIGACVLSDPVALEGTAPPLSPDDERTLAAPGSFALVGFGATEPFGRRDGHKRWLGTAALRPSRGKVDQIGDARHTACAGDSGGPALVRLRDGTWRTAAVASAAAGGACTGASNYVSLASHREWLAAIRGDGGYELPAKWGGGLLTLAGAVAVARRRRSVRIARK